MVVFSLVKNNEIQENLKPNITREGNIYTLNYPCESKSICTDFFSQFPRGVYKFELYGASSSQYSNDLLSTAYDNPNKNSCLYTAEEVKKYDGNTICKENSRNVPGSGVYVSAILNLRKSTKLYFSIGGQGEYSYKPTSEEPYSSENRPKGGYNGGGDGSNYYCLDKLIESGSSGGGGATDIKAEINDLFHRIIVAGGGGGTDNNNVDSESSQDDGSGGAGGGLEAQGYWIEGQYKDNCIANQINGFSFGYGESAQSTVLSNNLCPRTAGGNTDRAGAGGGWFGGFASHHGNGGAGGGSSFVLTNDSQIPKEEILVYNSKYTEKTKGFYAFSNESEYVMYNEIHAQ